MDEPEDSIETDAPPEDLRALAFMLAGTAFLGVLAYGLARLFGVSLAAHILWSARDAGLGLAAALPPVLFLFWFMKARQPKIVRFRRSQIEFFARLGFELTPVRIFAIAVFAGVFEELLFRGAIQAGVDRIAPGAVAVIAGGVLFGLVHWRTALYALIAAIIGVWLGFLFTATGNLLTPMATHGAYDLVALVITRQEIEKWRARSPHEETSDA